MCCPTGAGAITRGIMSSRNLRQTVLRRRKREPKPGQAIPRRRKCERNLRHVILRGRKCKRNLRHTILRWRKCKRNLGHVILRGRKYEPKPGHSIIRGWMRQTEFRAGRHPGVDWKRISERHYTAGNENNSFYQLFKFCNNYD